ncbi:MAG: pilus assembly protein [Actinomycetota bacterium]|nr:pilus assembly protein [Actinomycetota bacterium]
MKRRISAEHGSAILEFLIIGVLVLVPLLYITLTVLRVESAVFASTQAVREAARAFMMADSPTQGRYAAIAAARLAMSDQGFDMPDSALTISCNELCLSPGSATHLRLDWRVDLPWVPPLVEGERLGYPISVDSDVRVDSYRSDVSP